jgi:integrase
MIQEIKDKLKNKNINETSINKYVRDLILLNNKNDNINDLKFLKNTENIDKYIENDKYKDITKRNYYNSLNVITLLYTKYKKL